MKKVHLLFIAVLCCLTTVPTNLFAQANSIFDDKIFENESGRLLYRILAPKNIDPNKSYPLIIFLHGSGERGNDNELQLKHGGNLFAADTTRTKYPAFVVFPQCPEDGSWHNVEYDRSLEKVIFEFPRNSNNKKNDDSQLSLVEALIQDLINKNNIDTNRIYLGGLSMGGFGVFELVKRNPNKFAAAFPICGGAHPRMARRLRKTSFWIFHGKDDTVIPYTLSTQIFDALEKKAADVKMSIYPDVGHDSWTNAFAEPELLPWLFSKSNER